MLEVATFCLALNIFHEARGEGVAGQLAVAHVTMNRVHSDKYPNTICGVVTQRKQFSWTNTMLVKVKGGYVLKPSAVPKNKRAWNSAVKVAQYVINGKAHDITNGALFYHEKKISPYWAPNKALVTAYVGNHIFYGKSKSILNTIIAILLGVNLYVY